MKKSNLHILITCAVMIAAATVLSMIKLWEAPYGGSITLLSMVPILLVSCMFGVKWGLATGFVYSVVQLILGFSNVAYVPTAWGMFACIMLDYIIAFSVLGLAGLSVPNGLNGKHAILRATIGSAAALVARFVCHLISGAVIWYSLDLVWYADDPTHIVHKYGPWAFSAIYNGTFMLPEIVITLIALPFIFKFASSIKSKLSL